MRNEEHSAGEFNFNGRTGDSRAQSPARHVGSERKEGSQHFRSEHHEGVKRREGFSGGRRDDRRSGAPDADAEALRRERPNYESPDRETNGFAGWQDAARKNAAQPPRDKRRVHAPRDKAQGKGNSVRKQTLSPARLAALEATRSIRLRKAFAQDVIAHSIDRSSMSREDRAFATRLVLGVVSSYGTLDDIINRNLASLDDIDDEVRDALRISAYEMYILKKSAHAAVGQGVELVRSFNPAAAGFANAVLRKMCGTVAEFPYGDPAVNGNALARSYAFPAWLTEFLIGELGLEDAKLFMEASNEPAPLYLGINAALCNEEEALEVLTRVNADPTPVFFNEVPVVGCYRLANARCLVDPAVSKLLKDGKVVVSDAASQMVAQSVLPERKPARVLEVGVGRGTKTVLLQSAALRRWGSQIDEYDTIDNIAFKSQLTAQRSEALGIAVNESFTGDASTLDESIGAAQYDFIFIDAPCTGLGTLRRHPEIRWRLTPEAIEASAQRAAGLLASAASHVAPGGTLAYATCTVTRAENTAAVKSFLGSPAGSAFTLVAVNGKPAFASRLAPDGPDAHFCVCMKRKEV